MSAVSHQDLDEGRGIFIALTKSFDLAKKWEASSAYECYECFRFYEVVDKSKENWGQKDFDLWGI